MNAKLAVSVETPNNIFNQALIMHLLEKYGINLNDEEQKGLKCGKPYLARIVYASGNSLEPVWVCEIRLPNRRKIQAVYETMVNYAYLCFNTSSFIALNSVGKRYTPADYKGDTKVNANQDAKIVKDPKTGDYCLRRRFLILKP